jgi:deoxyribodipyrimidine photo-lyase
MLPQTLIWFRSDLRLEDHAGIDAALQSGLPIIPIYIYDQDLGTRPLGSASKWWLYHSLLSLSQSLETLGSRLILKSGNSLEILKSIISENNIKSVICSNTFEPKTEQFDSQFKVWCQKNSVETKVYNTFLLARPDSLMTKDERPYRVFTPFYRTLVANGFAEGIPPNSLPCSWPMPKAWPHSVNLDELRLLPKPTVSGADWASGFVKWIPGEKGAHQRLKAFLDTDLSQYADHRDRPDLDITSHLSAHLRFGEISPQRIIYEARKINESEGKLDKPLEKFRAELAWRDFSYSLLHQVNDIHTRNFKSEFDAMKWENNPNAFKAWCQGNTGYSLVDAGMRELWQTGIMHNRVRMVCASFLIKHLMIDWRLGEQWFWDTLLDADPANNPASWQWVAGSGADAAPYFRVFNPLSQAEKFDPEGLYRRQYIKGFDLKAHLSTLISPVTSQKPEPDLFDFSLKNNNNSSYPQPIIDHSLARERALAAFANLKAK